MEKITLKINGETDFEVTSPLVMIGRGSDNAISFPEDTNVSRYHARIEQREDGFWLVDQGSSNGTTLNGAPVEGEMLLQDGDTILFGGTSQLGVTIDDGKPAEEEEEADESAESNSVAASTPEETAKSNKTLYLTAGGIVGLAVVFIAVAGIVYFVRSSSGCNATAQIVSPDSGETISEAVDVEVKVTNPQCVQKAVFYVGEKEFASSNSEPFTVSLDPKQLPDDLADGDTYGLKVVLIDKSGARISQSNEIALAFETLEQKPGKTEVTEANTQTPQTPQTPQNPKVGVIDTQTMVTNLLKQFSGGSKYKLDQEFLVEVNKKTSEYVSEGYFARAMPYKDTINEEYVKEQNLDAPFGYVLAMSRSKFNPGKQADGEGLWRISKEVLEQNNFSLADNCGAETLSDPLQKCSTKVSAIYLKYLVLKVFDGDVIYSVSAVGMSPNDAAAFKATLPANREDFWKVIKSAKQREEIVRFFAAGIVAENPQKFGLKKDRPISELYKITIGN